MARFIFFRTHGVNAMGYSIQLDGDIVGAIVDHGAKPNPSPSATVKLSENDLSGVKLGWKYIEADGGFYELDDQGAIVNETFIALS